MLYGTHTVSRPMVRDFPGERHTCAVTVLLELELDHLVTFLKKVCLELAPDVASHPAPDRHPLTGEPAG